MPSLSSESSFPRGSIYTTIMELGPKNHNGDGLLGPNSIVAVYMDPLGSEPLKTLKPTNLERTDNKRLKFQRKMPR